MAAANGLVVDRDEERPDGGALLEALLRLRG